MGDPAFLRGKLGLVLMARAKFSKSLIQFCVDGWGCILSLLFDLRPNYGRGNEDNGDFLQKVPCRHYWTQCLWTCSRPLLILASTGDSWTLIGKSRSVSCGVTAPFSWVLVHTRFCLWPSKRSRAKANRILPRESTGHSKQQNKRRLYTWTSPDGQYQNQIDYNLCSQRWRSSI